MKNYKFSTIFTSSWMMFLLFFILLLTACSTEVLGLKIDMFLDSIRFGICLILIFLYIFNKKYSKFTICLILYYFTLLFSTFVNDASIKDFFLTYTPIVGLAILIEWQIRLNSKRTICIMRNVLILLTTINFFTIILFPDGLYRTELYWENWFFGYDNRHIIMYFPTLLLAILNCYLNGKKFDIPLIYTFGIITYSVFYCFSGNTVVAYSIFILYYLFSYVINNIKICNSITYLSVYLGMFVGLIFLRIQRLFAWFIVDILGKTLELSYRTRIWDTMIMYIKESPILGYGQEPTYVISQKMGSPFFTHAHNTLLDVMYKCGLLGVILYLFELIMVTKELYLERNTKTAKVISFVLLCFFIMMNIESRQEQIGLYIILILGYNVKFINKELFSKK